MHFTNISGYQFKKINKLTELQSQLREFCNNHAIKGTILLSQEGINLFLCATQKAISKIYTFLIKLGFQIDFKESLSKTIPFKYLRVKIKKEIITMGIPHIEPQKESAPYIKASKLKQWLDEGKTMRVLDTRNEYEVRIGKFNNAIDLKISSFRDFPQASREQLAHLKEEIIVTYCTGGIRCEKAALFLKSEGFQNVYQLEGGIIKYLEEVGNQHFEGECFVFDKRIALDGALQETTTVQCHFCRNPVTDKEQASNDYQYNVSCPQCIQKQSSVMPLTL